MAYLQEKKKFKKNFLKTYSEISKKELQVISLSSCEYCGTVNNRWELTMAKRENDDVIVCSDCLEKRELKKSTSKDAAIFEGASEAMKEVLK